MELQLNGRMPSGAISWRSEKSEFWFAASVKANRVISEPSRTGLFAAATAAFLFSDLPSEMTIVTTGAAKFRNPVPWTNSSFASTSMPEAASVGPGPFKSRLLMPEITPAAESYASKLNPMAPFLL